MWSMIERLRKVGQEFGMGWMLKEERVSEMELKEVEDGWEFQSPAIIERGEEERKEVRVEMGGFSLGGK